MPKPTANDRGQATVELALILPLFVLLVVALLEIAGLVRDQLLVDVLARDAARVASAATTTNGAYAAVADTVQSSGRSDATWRIHLDDDTVRVEVSITPRTSGISLALGWLGAPRDLSGSAVFALEHDIDDL